MSHEAEQEKSLSRRSFLKFGGLLGLAIGALSLPSLTWAEASTDSPPSAQQEPWMEAARRRRKRKASRRRRHS